MAVTLNDAMQSWPEDPVDSADNVVVTTGSDTKNVNVSDLVASAIGPTVYARNHVPITTTTAATVRTGLQAAITEAGVNGTLVFDPREYQLVGTGLYQDMLEPLDGQTWIGNGARLNTQTTYAGAKTIAVEGVDNVTIDGFHITVPNVTDAVGVMLIDCDGTRVTNNRFTNPKSGGVHGKGDIRNLLISDNVFKGTGYGVLLNDPSGAESVGSYNWTIANNICDGGGGIGDGISINRPTYPASGISITGNVCRNYAKSGENVGHGIQMANCSDVTISGNRCDGCARTGIHVEDGATLGVSITGNVVTNCNHAGIEVQTSVTIGSPSSVTITGNTVRGCCITPTVNLGKGGIEINFTTTDTTTMSTIVVSGNISTANNAGAGIYAYQAARSVFSNNVCTDSNGGVGMHLTSCTFCTVIGNVCTDTRAGGSKTQTHGL
jgi:parallel beta-helix repeat protein